MIKAHIYEMDYSVSPGGINCWEMDVNGYGYSNNYSDFNTAGEALNYLISLYPDKFVEIDITTLAAYNILHREEVNG